MDVQKFRLVGAGDRDERPQLVVVRPRVSRATSPSGLELHDGAILANHGSLNVDDSAERRVRNGRHKEALGGSARRGDRDGL